jgi:hypothetical protein
MDNEVKDWQEARFAQSFVGQAPPHHDREESCVEKTGLLVGAGQFFVLEHVVLPHK